MIRGLKKTLCTPGPRDPTETETELCLGVSCAGMGQQWSALGARALGAAGLGVSRSLWQRHGSAWAAVGLGANAKK